MGGSCWPADECRSLRQKLRPTSQRHRGVTPKEATSPKGRGATSGQNQILPRLRGWALSNFQKPKVPLPGGTRTSAKRVMPERVIPGQCSRVRFVFDALARPGRDARQRKKDEARRVTLMMACVQCPCSLGRHDPRCGPLLGKKSKARLRTSRVAASLWTYAPLYPHAAGAAAPPISTHRRS
jgi:hypothetical protein